MSPNANPTINLDQKVDQSLTQEVNLDQEVDQSLTQEVNQNPTQEATQNVNQRVNGVVIHAYERVDDLQRDGLRVIQDPKGFCFGIDAVCLSDFATIRKNEVVMDLCTGSGVIPILLCAKTAGAHFTGLELQPDSADRARRSVALNALADRIRIDQGDIKQAARRYGPAAFDVVTVNPPYMNGGLLNADDARTIARHEIACTLDDVVSAAARLLKTGGRLYMVHRPHRLADVCCALRRKRLEPKTLQLVQATPAKSPSLALIEAAHDGRPWLTVLPTRILDRSDLFD